jgi:hypothetical protein
MSTSGHFSRVVLAFGGLLLALAIMALALTLYPDLRPGGQRFVFTDLDGDTFRHQPGFVRPPEENRVLEDFIRRSDSDGFRQPRMTADHYPIIALGDSYTEGGETNWVDVLAAELDTPVRNLAWRGFGPLEEAEVMRQFGGTDHRWVLIGYFEGNDLSNVQTAHQTGELNIARGAEVNQHAAEVVTSEDGSYLYPLRHQINRQTVELAYISDYLWWLNGPESVYRDSQNMALLRDALADIQSLAGAACVGLVYMPSKAHIYFQMADPNGNRRFVLENGLALRLDSEGWLSFGALSPQDEAALFGNLNHQRDSVREVADALELYFIDLTPVLMAAAQHEVTYYPYDSHWNARGHELAGQTVAEFLRGQEECTRP